MCETLTPPKAAKEAGVHPGKIIGWIQRGELIAINLADQLGRRPRYRIRREDWDDFLRRREVKPRPRPTRKPKPQLTGKKYF